MKNTKKGFTLVELIVTIAIIGIIFGIGGTIITNIINNSKEQTIATSESNILKSARIYVEEYSNNIPWQQEETEQKKFTCVSVNELINKDLIKKENAKNLPSQYIIINKNSNNNTIISEEFDNKENKCGELFVKIPTAKEYCKELTYNPSEINRTLTKDISDTEKFTFSDNIGTNAGIYRVKATLKNTEDNEYYWEDGTRDTKTINCSIKKATPQIILTENGLDTSNYTIGETKNISIDSIDTPGTISLKISNNDYYSASITDENAKITETKLNTKLENIIQLKILSTRNALGFITITLIPNDTTNYHNSSKIFEINSTERKKVKIPTSDYINDLTYNGDEQTLINITKIKEEITNSEGIIFYNYTATDIGTYTITAKLKYGYIWEDGTTKEKTINCPIKAKINYNGNGGKTTSNTIYIVSPNKTHTVINNIFEYEGHTFNGWNTKADGSGTSYSVNDKITIDENVKNNITLYAQWEQNTLTVYYHSNEATKIKFLEEEITEEVMNAKSSTFYYSTTSENGLANLNTNTAFNLTKEGYTLTTNWLVGSETSTIKIPQDQGGTGQALAEAMGTSLKTGNQIVHVYAEWSENTLTIIYHSNNATRLEYKGAKISETDLVNEHTAEIKYLTNYENGLINGNSTSTLYLTKIGHKFTGNWLVGSETSTTKIPQDKGGTGQEIAEAMGTSLKTGSQTINVYAEWTISNYTLGYTLNDSSVSPANPTTYNVNTQNFSLNNPTKKGYTLSTWTESISTSNWYTGFINMNTGVVEKSSTYPNSVFSELIYLEAGVKYTISGTDLGGIRWRTYSTTGEYLSSASTTNTYTPSSNQYVRILLFEGCTATNRNEATITSSQGTSVTIVKGSTGNRNYLPNFTDNTLTIIYHSNGATALEYAGEAITEEVLATKKSTFKYSVNSTNGLMNGNSSSTLNLTKTGANFTGNWIVGSATGTTKISQSLGGTGQEFAVLMGTSLEDGSKTVNVYAEWTPKTVTVTFYKNTSSSDTKTATQKLTYGVSGQSFNNPNWNRTGYTHAGWAFEAAATEKKYNITNGVSNTWIEKYSPSTSLYAVWTPNTYTITYNGNGHTGGTTANSTHTYGTAKNLTANGFTKTTHTFNGWNTKSDGSGTSYTDKQSVKNLTSTNNGKVTLFAQWKTTGLYLCRSAATDEYQRSTTAMYSLPNWEGFQVSIYSGGDPLTILGESGNFYYVQVPDTAEYASTNPNYEDPSKGYIYKGCLAEVPPTVQWCPWSQCKY